MTPMFLRVCSMAAALAISMAAFARTTGQQPAQPQPRTQTTTPAPQHPGSAGQMVRVAGCIQSEADYRKARNLGRGGTAGTGVGVGNEFVLIDTEMASPGAPPAAGAATGTTGAAAKTISSQERTRARRRRSSVNASRSPARSRRPR